MHGLLMKYVYDIVMKKDAGIRPAIVLAGGFSKYRRWRWQSRQRVFTNSLEHRMIPKVKVSCLQIEQTFL